MNPFKKIGAWFSRLFWKIRSKFMKPEALMDEQIMKLIDELVEVKKDASYVIGREKEQMKKLLTMDAVLKQYDTHIQEAILGDNDTYAKELLQKKSVYQVQRDAYAEKAMQTKSCADQMRQLHDQLVDQVEDLRSRKSLIQSKMALAEATEAINEIHEKMNKTSGIKETFAQIDKKANEKLDYEQALKELDETSLDAQLEKLKAKYSAM